MSSASVWGLRGRGVPVRATQLLLPLASGHQMPALGFGTYRIRPSEVSDAVSYAVECGFRHIDCAKIYLNQKEVGASLSRILRTNTSSRDGGVKREDLFVTSKLWPTDQHPDHVEAACRDTLRELQLDYLDLYLIHWPIAWEHTGNYETDDGRHPRNAQGGARVNTSVSLLDTWKAMTHLVDLGLVKSIGLSNCNADQVRAVAHASSSEKHYPVTNQIEFHPGCYQSELRSEHDSLDVVTTAYCPLGMPTRFTRADFKGVAQDGLLTALSEQSGFSVPRVLLNWNLDNGNAVVVKSTKREHIADNSKACRFALSDSVRWFLNHYEDQLQQGVRVINPSDFREGHEPFFPPRQVKRREHQP